MKKIIEYSLMALFILTTNGCALRSHSGTILFKVVDENGISIKHRELNLEIISLSQSLNKVKTNENGMTTINFKEKTCYSDLKLKILVKDSKNKIKCRMSKILIKASNINEQEGETPSNSENLLPHVLMYLNNETNQLKSYRIIKG